MALVLPILSMLWDLFLRSSDLVASLKKFSVHFTMGRSEGYGLPQSLSSTEPSHLHWYPRPWGTLKFPFQIKTEIF